MRVEVTGLVVSRRTRTAAQVRQGGDTKFSRLGGRKEDPLIKFVVLPFFSIRLITLTTSVRCEAFTRVRANRTVVLNILPERCRYLRCKWRFRFHLFVGHAVRCKRARWPLIHEQNTLKSSLACKLIPVRDDQTFDLGCNHGHVLQKVRRVACFYRLQHVPRSELPSTVGNAPGANVRFVVPARSTDVGLNRSVSTCVHGSGLGV